MLQDLTVYQQLSPIADRLSKSSLIPRSFKRAEDALYALALGHELGLSPIYSLTNIAVINDKPSLSADSKLAICKSSPEFGGVEIKDAPDSCTVTLKRNYANGTQETRTVSFTMADARKAGLIRSGTPWEKYPQRMLRARALGYACNDVFSDLLAGIYTPEEVQEFTENPSTPKTPRKKVETPQYEVVETIEEEIIPTIALEPAPAQPVTTPTTDPKVTTLHDAIGGVLRLMHDQGLSGYADYDVMRSDIKAALGVENVRQCTDASLLSGFLTSLEAVTRSDTPFNPPVNSAPVADLDELRDTIDREISLREMTAGEADYYATEALKSTSAGFLESILKSVQGHKQKPTVASSDAIELQGKVRAKLQYLVEQRIDGFEVSKRMTNSMLEWLGVKKLGECQDVEKLAVYLDHLTAKMEEVA